MELAILLVVVAVLAGMLFATFKGVSATTGTEDDAEEHAVPRVVRRYWWLAPVLILVSGFLL